MATKRIKSVSTEGVFLSTVVVDTREQLPYSFEGMLCDEGDGGGALTVPVVPGALHSGDYTLAGFEDEVAIERKSLADLYGTIGQGRDRFERELERLANFRFASVVIEANWNAILAGTANSSLSPKTVFRSIVAWQQRFPIVHWWPCENRRMAEVVTFRILERFWKEQ